MAILLYLREFQAKMQAIDATFYTARPDLTDDLIDHSLRTLYSAPNIYQNKYSPEPPPFKPQTAWDSTGTVFSLC